MSVLQSIRKGVEAIPRTADDLVAASKLLQQTSDMGLVHIYPTRPDAIEEEFFAVMQREEEGSTSSAARSSGPGATTG